MQKFSIREALSFGFKSYYEHWQALLATALIVISPRLILAIISMMIGSEELILDGEVSGYLALVINFLKHHKLIIVFFPLYSFLMLALSYNYIKLALQLHDYNAGSVKSMFSWGKDVRVFITAMVVTALFFLAIAAVLIGIGYSGVILLENQSFFLRQCFIVVGSLCIFSYYYVVVRCVFFPFALVDGKTSIKNAFLYSWKITVGSFWKVSLLIFLIGLIESILKTGFVLFILSLPFSLLMSGGGIFGPIFMMSMVYVYRKLGAAYSLEVTQ